MVIKIGIVGSRSKDSEDDYEIMLSTLIQLVERLGIKKEEDINIISGGCSHGGDRFAEVISKRTGVPITIYKADWDKFGKRAGAIRNKKIAQESDYLIACVSDDRTGGTEITINEFINRKGKDKLIIV